MNVLVVGSGGREHAICWALSKSNRKPKIYCAPGNAGIAQIAECLDILSDDIPALVKWANDNDPNLIVVGPEVPLCMGITDELIKEGFQVFGPTKDGAQLEGSKDFTKKILVENNIPTAKSKTFTDYKKALAYIRTEGTPIVIKADGLAAGKGVTVCENFSQAEKALSEALKTKIFGEAGSKVLIEEFLEGEEASILAFVDGESIVPMVSAQDHKRVNDGDLGPNTGGMGAYSPAPIVTSDLNKQILENILKPTILALKRMGITYKGVLYAGLMITKDGPKVIEYNCRFGDPETQVILPRLKTDFVNICLAVVQGKLSHLNIEWDERPAACVVMASKGYPGSYSKGIPIDGLETPSLDSDTFIFHAGTTFNGNKVVTSGGRVLSVTGIGTTLDQAVRRAYQTVETIRFQGAHYRKDIAWRAFKKNEP